MKIRNGFVSNSSSSSFTCDICGITEVVYDGIDDADMQECAEGHCWCNSHVREPTVTEVKQFWIDQGKIGEEYYEDLSDDEILDENSFDGAGSSYEVIPPFCRLCNFEEYNNSEAIIALKKHFDLKEQDILDIMKSQHEKT